LPLGKQGHFNGKNEKKIASVQLLFKDSLLREAKIAHAKHT